MERINQALYPQILFQVLDWKGGKGANYFPLTNPVSSIRTLTKSRGAILRKIRENKLHLGGIKINYIKY